MRSPTRLAGFSLALLAASCGGQESLGNKSEWSALQGVEYDHRHALASQPVILAISSYRVAGFPRTDSPGYVWVLLNPEHAPYYKQLPQGPYHLSATQLAGLKVKDPRVLAELRAHVRE